jgi:photosystem II stability/assembly factor-like uncharacterized protein
LAKSSFRLLAALVLLSAGLPSPLVAEQSATDAVEHSVEAPLASRSLLLDGIFVDGLAVAVGERGHVLVSQDQGRSWRQLEVPTRATLTGVHFHDKQLGWVVGHDATILRTLDGGATWDRVYYDPGEESPLFDVWFRDAENGFAVGAYGLFLVTSDGGATWTRQTVEEDEYSDFHLHHIASTKSGRLFMAAEAGTIYRSDDAGRTWLSLPSPYAGSFFGTLLLDDDALLLFGLRGHLFRSEDAGETWQEVETGSVALLNRGLRTSSGKLIVVGHEGTLLISDDGGRSFTLREQPDRQALATLIEADDGGLILVGEFGVNRLAEDGTVTVPAPWSRP